MEDSQNKFYFAYPDYVIIQIIHHFSSLKFELKNTLSSEFQFQSFFSKNL